LGDVPLTSTKNGAGAAGASRLRRRRAGDRPTGCWGTPLQGALDERCRVLATAAV